MKTQEILARDVKSYVKTLADIVSGNDAFRELSEDADTGEFDFDSEYDRLRWYFEDVLDVEFCVDSRLEYKGAKITLACGGPGIVFDTQSGEVNFNENRKECVIGFVIGEILAAITLYPF